MILITKIEFEETPYNPHQLYHFKHQQGYLNPEQCTKDLCTGVLSELIHGQRFTRPDGTEVTIGMSKQAADLIGIQYKAWGVNERHCEVLKEELGKSNKDKAQAQSRVFNLNETLDDLEEIVEKAKQAKFLTRLKWLFTGVKL